MTNKWRPKGGWLNPYHYEGHLPAGGLTDTNLLRVIEEQSHIVYEAGADAMLKALRKEGKAVKDRRVLSYFPMLGKSKIVIIPDEE